MPRRSPGHIHATRYARSGLFKGVKSFSEIEWRIEALPTEQERGAAFEVFVEAYLNTAEVAQADVVWVGDRIPPGIRRELNLPRKDFGCDGVYRTRAGELAQYQAKFRTGRTPLTFRNLSTFFGITGPGTRVLITNSAGMSEVARSRKDFYAVRGSDFDRLDATQLAQIAAWVHGTACPSGKHA